MKVLMLAKQKGGSGASTLARELGVVAADEGQRVVFVDLDPQASLSKWWNRRTAEATSVPNPALAAPPRPEELLAMLDRLRGAKAADLCIIDVPPSIHAFLSGVMHAADLILVPVRPTADDFDALPDIVELIEASGRRYAFVLTQAPTGHRVRAIDDALPILARQGRVAPIVRFRADFPAAAVSGRTATEFASSGKAADEVRALWQFARAELGKSKSRRAA